MSAVARSGSDGPRRHLTPFRFTDGRNVLFVELLGREPCLWNQRPYSMRARNAALKRIQAGLNAQLICREAPLHLDGVRIKISDMRRHYTQELRKMRLNQNYKPKFAWFEPLHAFLGESSDSLDPKRDLSSPQLKQFKIRLTRLKQLPLPTQIKLEPQGVLVTVEEPKRTAFTVLPAPMPPPPPPLVPAIIAHPPPPPVVSSSVSHFCEISPTKMPPNEGGGGEEGRGGGRRHSEDEFTFFGLSVAAQLRNMPLESAMIMQSKIQYLLSIERRKINGHTTDVNLF
ncbi:uncharacterized protein [Drosophila tropicalis]|uniref:uncharacterized protein n=1 Tax=Drosophila tropicalis TaxID=46794 RepID=UPI0035ABB0E4